MSLVWYKAIQLQNTISVAKDTLNSLNMYTCFLTWRLQQYVHRNYGVAYSGSTQINLRLTAAPAVPNQVQNIIYNAPHEEDNATALSSRWNHACDSACDMNMILHKFKKVGIGLREWPPRETVSKTTLDRTTKHQCPHDGDL